MEVDGAAHVQSLSKSDRIASEHTIDWDDWIEAWVKVQQDHSKRLSVWSGIMRLRDQTLCYHDPICTARYFWTLHKSSFLLTFLKGPVWARKRKRGKEKGNNEMERHDKLYLPVHNWHTFPHMVKLSSVHLTWAFTVTSVICCKVLYLKDCKAYQY